MFLTLLSNLLFLKLLLFYLATIVVIFNNKYLTNIRAQNIKRNNITKVANLTSIANIFNQIFLIQITKTRNTTSKTNRSNLNNYNQLY